MKRAILSFTLPLLLAAQTVHGHAQLEDSIPTDRAVLESAPAEIVLVFSEGVRLTALSVEKSGAPPEDIESLPEGMNARIAVPAPELAGGQYTLTWRALSADTHVLSGEIRFTVGGSGFESSGGSD